MLYILKNDININKKKKDYRDTHADAVSVTSAFV